MILNSLAYYWKRNNWMIKPGSYFREFANVPIHKPIFLLGVQGGGLTIVSRILRRHPSVVSVTGNNHYWTGADEMHTVLGPLLPAELAGTRYKVPNPGHSLFRPPRSWTYACDELLPLYRKTAADATPELKHKFERVIRMTLTRHVPDKGPGRFSDKSQVFTVRVSLIRELLSEHGPKFLLVAMNPYAACAKAAQGKAIDMKNLRRKLSFGERLNLCAQHWANSMSCALKDRAEDMKTVRFEDILEDPAGSIKRICDFLELEFHERMLPSQGQTIPLGSRFPERWFPWEPQRNQSYIQNLKKTELEIVSRKCEGIVGAIGYDLL